MQTNETAGEQRKSALAKKGGKKREEKSFYFLFFPQVVAPFFQSAFFTSVLFTCYDRPLQAKLNLVKAQEMDTN